MKGVLNLNNNINNNPISKLIGLLYNTDLQWTASTLHEKIDYVEYEDNLYCLIGVPCKEAGLKNFEGMADLEDLEHDDVDVLNEYCGFNLQYRYRLDIVCPLLYNGVNICGDHLTSPEHVFWHINDEHNFKGNHKENARLLEEFSNYYNIIDGTTKFNTCKSCNDKIKVNHTYCNGCAEDL